MNEWNEHMKERVSSIGVHMLRDAAALHIALLLTGQGCVCALQCVPFLAPTYIPAYGVEGVRSHYLLRTHIHLLNLNHRF